MMKDVDENQTREKTKEEEPQDKTDEKGSCCCGCVPPMGKK